MSSIVLHEGDILSLLRSQLQVLGPASSSSSSPPAPIAIATLVGRTGGTTRGWKVRLDSDPTEYNIATRKILAAIVVPPAPPPPENLRVRREVDLGPAVSYADDDSEYDGSEDSADDGEESGADEDEPEVKIPAPPPNPLEPHGLKWTPLDPDAVLVDSRQLLPMSMYVRWSAIGLDQLGSAAIKLQTDSQDPLTRRPIHYFMLSFPLALVHGIVDRTNNKIVSAG